MSYPASALVDLAGPSADGLARLYAVGEPGPVRDLITGAAATPVGATLTGDQFGPARQFNGLSDRVTIAPPITRYPYAVAAWVRIPSRDASDRFVFSQAASADNNNFIGIGTTGALPGRATYYCRTAGVTMVINGAIPINDGCPHLLIAASFSASDHRLYVDAELDGTSNVNLGSLFTADVAEVGVLRRSNYLYYWTGNIGQIAVWNRGIGLAEAEALFSDWDSSLNNQDSFAVLFSQNQIVLIGNGQVGAGAETTDSIIQTHALAGVAQAGVGTQATGPLAQIHTLAGIGQTGIGGQVTGTLAQTYALAGTDQVEVGGQASGVLAQDHALTGFDQCGTGTQTDGALTEITHVLTVSPQTGIGAQAPGRVEQSHVLAGLNQLGTPQITVGAIIGRGLGILINPTSRRVTPARDLRSASNG